MDKTSPSAETRESTVSAQKKQIRRDIARWKCALSDEQSLQLAEQIYVHVANWELFRKAKTILLYHSLPDEVSTLCFLERIYPAKQVLLPVVCGEELELRLYQGTDALQAGAFQVHEPTGETFTKYDKIDLCLIPGVAFDPQGGRLGRGKGYYDRLLPCIQAPKAGICYECQLLREVPKDSHDVRMDYLFTESGILIC